MSIKHTEAAALDLASRLFAAELSIEEALGQAASVMAAMPAFKQTAGLTVFHGQDVLEEAAALTTLLTQARRVAAQLHKKMEATQRQIGLKHLAVGPGGKPPSEEGMFMRAVA